MRTPSLLIATLFTSLVLGGCVSSSGSPGSTSSIAPSASAPQFSDETGAIRGLVLNEEQMPLAGATVGLVGVPGPTSTTAANGEFTLNDLPPAEYTVSVAALGYESVAKKVGVAAGEVASVNFLLTAIASDEPYPATIQRAGNVLCSVTFFPGFPLAGAVPPGWYTGLQACGLAPESTAVGDNKFVQSYPIPKGTREMLAEMTWRSTQVTGTGLSLIWEGAANDGHPIYGSASGKSPLRIVANETKVLNVTGTYNIDPSTSEFKVQSRTFSSANTTEFYLPTQMPVVPVVGAPSNKVDVGFAYNQRYDVYVTAFVGMTMPDGFSALADK